MNSGNQMKRKETEETFKNGERHRDGSELVVSDVSAYNGAPKPGEKKRHHHHHHHHEAGRSSHKEGREWRDSRPPLHRDHKRY